MIRSTMQRAPLSLNQILERAGKLYPESEIVTRLPTDSRASTRSRARLPASSGG